MTSAFIRGNPRLKIVFLALFTFAASCVIATTASSSNELTPAERRGKAIYLRGESPSGKEIKAMVGELDVPASTVTCAGCHGLRGEGKTEGGVTAGNLTWSNLDRKSTRLNSSHSQISYAVFCLKKKKK